MRRNLELIWLTGRLTPDFKTIADFRKDNGSAIRKVCQQFVALCRNMDLLDGDVVAIDGSRFKVVNSKAKNYTHGKLRQKLGEIDKAIERYLGELDRADEVFEKTGTVLPEARMERTLRKLEHLQKEATRYRSIELHMAETGETQVSLSDHDARSMVTTARMPRIVGYNVQTAVEADNHLIVAHEVTMLGFDQDALSMMAVAARAAMTTDQITAIADKGYYKGEEIVASEEAGISVVVPKPMTSNAAARGQFDKADFAYDSDLDVDICPAGENLTYRFTGQQDGKAIRSYWSATGIRLAAAAEKDAASDRAAAKLEEAQADASAMIVRADAKKADMLATAEGQTALANSENELSAEIIAMKVRLAGLEAMPAIIAEMVKPAEKIDSIKIHQVTGMGRGGVGEGSSGGGTPVNQALDSVLGMALQMPAMQALGKELGISLENGVAGVANDILDVPNTEKKSVDSSQGEAANS